MCCPNQCTLNTQVRSYYDRKSCDKPKSEDNCYFDLKLVLYNTWLLRYRFYITIRVTAQYNGMALLKSDSLGLTRNFHFS
jgi:hypothetical protein